MGRRCQFVPRRHECLSLLELAGKKLPVAGGQLLAPDCVMSAPASGPTDDAPWMAEDLTAPLIQKYENRIRELVTASVLHAETMEEMRRKVEDVTTVRKKDANTF